jgi:hypothetical protein
MLSLISKHSRYNTVLKHICSQCLSLNLLQNTNIKYWPVSSLHINFPTQFGPLNKLRSSLWNIHFRRYLITFSRLPFLRTRIVLETVVPDLSRLLSLNLGRLLPMLAASDTCLLTSVTDFLEICLYVVSISFANRLLLLQRSKYWKLSKSVCLS